MKLDKIITYGIFKNSDYSKNEFTFGLNENCGLRKELIEKINKGISTMGMPYNEGIPFFKNSIFIFQEVNDIIYFLTNMCNLSSSEMNELEEYGYKIYEFYSPEICRGFSSHRGAIFSDELIKVKEFSFNELCKDFECDPFTLHKIPSKEISYCKKMYYQNVEHI